MRKLLVALLALAIFPLALAQAPQLENKPRLRVGKELLIPTGTDCNTLTYFAAAGICWDSTTSLLMCYNGAAWVTCNAAGGGTGVGPHAFLSSTHTDTAASGATRGDIITAQGSTPAWTRLAKGSQYQVFLGGATEPGWGAVSLAQATAVSGTLGVANGGTGGTATPTLGGAAYGTGSALAYTAVGTVGQCLLSNAGAAPAWGSCLGTGSNHNLLSATHPDTAVGTPVRGDLLVANTTPAWTKLAKGSAYQTLTMGSAGTDPGWAALDLSQSAATTNILPTNRGGTGTTSTPTAGGVTYGTGTTQAYTAAGTAGNCLVSGGSSAPTWSTCSSGGGGITVVGTPTADNLAVWASPSSQKDVIGLKYDSTNGLQTPDPGDGKRGMTLTQNSVRVGIPASTQSVMEAGTDGTYRFRNSALGSASGTLVSGHYSGTTQVVAGGSTTTETVISGSGIGTMTIAAGTTYTGRAWRLHGYGSLTVASAVQLTIRVKLGSTVVGQAIFTPSATGKVGTVIDSLVTVTNYSGTNGSTSSVSGDISVSISGASPAFASSTPGAVSPVPLDSAQAFAITAQWSSVNASNSVTLDHFTLEEVY